MMKKRISYSSTNKWDQHFDRILSIMPFHSRISKRPFKISLYIIYWFTLKKTPITPIQIRINGPISAL